MCAFRYTYFTLFFGLALTPFLGLTVSIPTGHLLFGERAFGGSIDISAAEVVLGIVLLVWAVKLLMYWFRRHDAQWRPRLPLIGSYSALVAAHLISGVSPLLPDPVLVAKFAFRPVLFSYLAFIALPVNLLRSRQRLITVLGILSAVGVFAAVTGLVSVFFPSGGAFVGRAHPLPLFGVSALGENHNELAELLVWTSLVSIALAELISDVRWRRLLYGAAAFQACIVLFTFTRTGWIVLLAEAAVLCATVWRDRIRRHLRALCITGLLLLPLAGAMAAYSVSESASDSTSTRLMLSEIAWSLFRSSPWVGAGAGSFFDRVGATHIFLQEYGAPLDSHGILQKIGAETGAFGLLALCAVMLHFVALIRRGLPRITSSSSQRAFVMLATAAGGAFFYQVFNTAYWTGTLWLPIGLALVAARVFVDQEA